jgi:hypothetical protein
MRQGGGRARRTYATEWPVIALSLISFSLTLCGITKDSNWPLSRLSGISFPAIPGV